MLHSVYPRHFGIDPNLQDARIRRLARGPVLSGRGPLRLHGCRKFLLRTWRRPPPNRGRRLRGTFQVNDFVAHPESPVLVNALLTGDKSGLDKDIISAFRDSGAAHILALSGLHLGIIYGILRKVTSVMGNSPTANKIRSAGIIFTTFLYTLATGAGPSLVRAQLFITINEISHLAQRRTSLGKVYCSALLIQLTMNPLVISSVGFQLSYMAMAGIVVLYPRMKAWFPENEEGRTKFVSYVPKKMWDAMALAISCQIFTGPVAWLYFGTFPKYFIITNMFALPITSLLMIMATLTATLSAAGLCPTIIISITDKLSMMLIDIVKIIAGL